MCFRLSRDAVTKGFEKFNNRLGTALTVVPPHPLVYAGTRVAGQLLAFEAIPQVVIGLVVSLASADSSAVSGSGQLANIHNKMSVQPLERLT